MWPTHACWTSFARCSVDRLPLEQLLSLSLFVSFSASFLTKSFVAYQNHTSLSVSVLCNKTTTKLQASIDSAPPNGCQMRPWCQTRSVQPNSFIPQGQCPDLKRQQPAATPVQLPRL